MLQMRPVVDSVTAMEHQESKKMGSPIIETERLILRAHRLDDFPALAAMWGDPVVARFISGQPSTP